MLVLSRKKNEAIIIGDDVELSIISIDGDNVKIGIRAPKSISILRKELLDEVADANRESVQKSSPSSVDIKDFKLSK